MRETHEVTRTMKAVRRLQALTVASALALATLMVSGAPVSVAARSSGCTVSQANDGAAVMTTVVCPDNVPIPPQYLPTQYQKTGHSSHIRSSTMVDPYILWSCGYGVTCYAFAHDGYGTANYTWFIEDRSGNLTTRSGSAFCGSSGCTFIASMNPNDNQKEVIELFAMGPAFVFTDCWCFTIFGGYCTIYN
jgi:hypothetical protein